LLGLWIALALAAPTDEALTVDEAIALAMEGRLEEAEVALTATIARLKDAPGEEEAHVSALGTYSVLLSNMERFEDALAANGRHVAAARAHHGDSHEELALALYQQGYTLFLVEQHAEAIPVLTEARRIQLDVLGAAAHDIAATDMVLANHYRALGRPESAIVHARDALSHHLEHGVDDNILEQTCHTLFDLLERDRAAKTEVFSQTMSLIETVEIDDPYDYLDLLVNLSKRAQEIGDPRRGHKALERAKSYLDQAQAEVAEVTLVTRLQIYRRLAAARIRAADVNGAHEILDQMEAIGEGFEDAVFRQDLADLRSQAFYVNGDFEAAETEARRSLARNPRETNVLHNVGALLSDMGRPEEGLVYLKRALRIEEANGSSLSSQATTHNSMAKTWLLLGDIERARDETERAVELWIEGRGLDHPDVATGYNNLGEIARRLGDRTTARAHFDRALQVWENTLGPDHPEVANATHNIAGLLALSEQPDAAEPWFARTLAILEPALGLDNVELAPTYMSQCGYERRRGNYDRAEDLALKAQQLWIEALGRGHDDTTIPMAAMARIAFDRGDQETALVLMQKVIRTREAAVGPDHPDMASALGATASLLADAKRHDEAREHRQRAYDLGSRHLRHVLGGLSEREQLGLLSRELDQVRAYVNTFSRPGDESRAYQVVLDWKGAVRQLSIDARSAALENGEDMDRVRDLRHRIAQHVLAPYAEDQTQSRNEEIRELTLERERLERAIARQNRAFRAENAAQHATVADVCAALPPDTQLVDFLWTPTGYVSFVVDGDCALKRIDIPDSAGIDENAQRLRHLLATDAMPTRIFQTSVALREQLWDPLAPALVNNRIIIVPDGPLSVVPFGALALGDGRYLLEDLRISYTETASDLVRWKRAEPVKKDGVLLVGGVEYGDAPTNESEGLLAMRSACLERDFDPLPGTRGEVEELASAFEERKLEARVLTDDAPTEATLAQEVQGQRILHLATHGFFASGQCKSALGGDAGINPMLLSGVVLAGANQPSDVGGDTDALWTAEEVALLDLEGTELVVLSACETGLGEIAPGDGVLGLRRAFSVAGARTTVMSLWPVPDLTTRRLMIDMYEGILRKKKPLSTADALREAQLAILEEIRAEGKLLSPHVWAAFVASGAAVDD